MAERWALAVDLGGTKVESALVDEHGRILDGTRAREGTGRQAASGEIEAAVVRCIARTMAVADGVALAGAGVASAGPVSVPSGTVSPINLPAWREYPLRALVADAVGRDDVVLRLDGLCIALAETWLGGLRGIGTGMAMVVSTGIGGGLLVGGRLVAGASGNAGHVGQMLIADPEDPAAVTSLESVASGPHVVAWANAHGWHGSTGEEFAASVSEGDPIALAVLQRSADALGRAIASVAALLDLERVTIGGGFANGSPDLVDRIRASFAASVALDSARAVHIRRTALGDTGPLQGAAGLVHRADLLPRP